MASGIEALRKIQIGREATAGTKVAATAKLIGKLTMAEEVLLHRPDEERGSLADIFRTILVGERVGLTFDGLVNFEQLPYLLSMAITNKINGDTANPTQGKYYNNVTYVDMPNAIDGAAGTAHTLAAYLTATDSILICAAAKFRGIKVDIGSTPNAVASTVTVQCSNGAGGWLAATLIADNTKPGAASMAQDGTIEFTPHASWASDTIDGDAGFWVKLTWSANWTASVIINDCYTIAFASVWTYAPVLTAGNTPQSYTVEYGDDVQEYEAEYVVARDMEISGGIDAPLAAKAGLFGRNLAASTFTGALTDPTLETAVNNKSRLYIDATGGTIGSTEKATTLISWSAKITTGFTPVVHGSANLFFDALAETKKKISVDMTIAFNSGVETERTMYAAGTRRLFRLRSVGSLIAGTDYKQLTVDFAGVYTKWSTLQSRDGEDTVAVTVEGEYDSTYGKLFEIVVQNTVAVLP